MQEKDYMELAVSLAKKGTGRVNPNPLVGAVIVKDDQIIGTGFHEQYGGLHAERNALKNCKTSPEGASIYVTLTPCCHYGKTPPCTEAIIESGISRVVIGSRDPNPLVGAKSIAILEQAGIEVVTDFMKETCDDLNPVFFHYITEKTPYVVMKYASTLDGKIATRTGASKWITGKASRARVQESRNQYMGIMAGSGTVLKDDPLLTCRIPGGRNPIRIICDTKLVTPLDSQLVKTAGKIPLILATGVQDEERLTPYKEAGCQILAAHLTPEGHIDLRDLMKQLGAMGIDSILLEGGGTLNWSALKSGIVHKIEAYIAPKIFGGETAPSPIRGEGIAFPSEAVELEHIHITQIDQDLLIEGEVKTCLQES